MVKWNLEIKTKQYEYIQLLYKFTFNLGGPGVIIIYMKGAWRFIGNETIISFTPPFGRV